MPTKDPCCWNTRKNCNIHRHHYLPNGHCVENDTDERCDRDPLMLPRVCYDYSDTKPRLKFQCCDGGYINFENWKSWTRSRCRQYEDRRVDFESCLPQDDAPSNTFSFMTIFIIVTVLVVFFGLVIVIAKRLRYRSERRSRGRSSSSAAPRRSTAAAAAATRRSSVTPPPSIDDRPDPVGTENDLAPPSYEEAVLLTDRPPAFDKLTTV